MQWIRDGQCLNTALLAGTEISGDLGQSALLVSVPQAYLEYTDSEWDPPSRWDDGILGLLPITVSTRKPDMKMGVMTLTTSAVMVRSALTLGRGAYELTGRAIISIPAVTMTATLTIAVRKNWEWSRYYAWRALPSLKAKLSLGEDYLNSDIFDGFSYIGGSISTDDQMLPPNLRGYAPDISGVAHTTAKVTVTQMGRVIYETQVPAGPFRIQDIGDSVSGTLHVRIEEQNGQVQEYDVSTASMPF